MNFATSQYRYSCVSLIVAVTAAAVLNATPAAAQTLGGGDSHSIVLKSDGTVWTFGYNCLVYRISVNQTGGKNLLEGLLWPRPLILTRSRIFENGSVVLCYALEEAA